MLTFDDKRFFVPQEVCAGVPRVSIRESCKQLVWSTGTPYSFLPPGDTKEVHQWLTNGQCDRRMRCVDGACKWTSLAVNKNGANPPSVDSSKSPVFQRRQSSAQIGLAVDYEFTPIDFEGFLSYLGPLIQATDTRRLQILSTGSSARASVINTAILGTTFAVSRLGRVHRMHPSEIAGARDW